MRSQIVPGISSNSREPLTDAKRFSRLVGNNLRTSQPYIVANPGAEGMTRRQQQQGFPHIVREG